MTNKTNNSIPESTSINSPAIRDFLFKLENPQVYTGKEINASGKGFVKERVNICLVFPDTYEIGMSHYGLQLLYHLLNDMEHVNAERCFLPPMESIKTFKKENMPLFSLESKQPLKDFDLIGFSLLSELTYTNVLQILDLAQVPLFRDQRKDSRFPFIAAGGISVVNPEPLRDFIDIFAIGDGEILFPKIVSILSGFKAGELNRERALSCFEEVDGLYIPARSPLKKRGRFYVPEVKKGRIRKAVAKEIDAGAVIPDHRIIAPITNAVFDRLTVEIARGCPQNCRFCQAKVYYSPYRAQTPAKTMVNIQEGLKHSGFDAFSLSSLSAGDYPWLEQLLRLIPRVIRPGTSMSLPSLRPSTLSEDLLSTLSLFRRTGITIVPEAGTERLRKVINKNVTDEEIFTAVDLALRYNWQKIKLYFMLGLPTETMEDIDGIIQVIKAVMEKAAAAKKKVEIHASFSPFVPKPHTPLQWAEQVGVDAIFEKIKYLKANLRQSKRLDLDIHRPHKAVVETILARGDYRVGQLLHQAFKDNEILCAWDKHFHFPVWSELMEGGEYHEFLSEIGTDEVLPWEFIEVNYRKEYLVKEYQKAHEAHGTPPCGRMTCAECGGCFYGYTPPAENEEDTAIQLEPIEEGEIGYNKVRLFYEKTGDYLLFSHLSILKYVERLIRKSGISFKCSEGFHPRIKITSLPPLPVFATGLEEVIEFFADDRLSTHEIRERLNRASGDETFQFKKVTFTNDSRPLNKDIHYVGLEIEVPGLNEDMEQLETIKGFLGETDGFSLDGCRLILNMDYAHNGQERFGKVYRFIDPERKHTVRLTRTHVTFKEPLK